MLGGKILLYPGNNVKESVQFHCVCIKKKKIRKKLTKSSHHLKTEALTGMFLEATNSLSQQLPFLCMEFITH